MAGDQERLTDEQRRAITTRTASVSLSAGAGCGKTYVLTRRFLSHLEPDPADLESADSQAATDRVSDRLSRLVAITFTERAAREMRDRIRSVCRERLLTRDARESTHWLALLRALDAARISTIHSFCGSLLRTHAVEAALDPHFSTLDEAQSSAIVAELTDDQLRRRLAAGDELAVDLAHRFGISQLKGLIGELLAQRQKIDWTRWQTATPEEMVERWERFRREEAAPRVLQAFRQSRDVRATLELLREHEPANAIMSDRRVALLELLAGLGNAKKLEESLAQIREQSVVKGGGGVKAWGDPAVYGMVRDCLAGLRKAVDKLRDKFEWNPDEALIAARQGLSLFKLTARLVEAYEARKRDLAALDFDDLILRTRDLLVRPQNAGLRRRISERLELVLVDEFQDTDPVQTDLVRALCGSGLLTGKLFFVGDRQQSIYRFRGADPQVFRALSQELPAEGRLPLSMNFRSQPSVLNFTNYLFCESLARDGSDYQPLRPSRPQITPEPAIEFLWAPAAIQNEDETEEGEPPPDRESAGDLRRREATWIAQRLRQMFTSGEPLVHDTAAGETALRPARPGDVAILFKTLSDVQHYEAALREQGIDYYLVGGHAFYSQQEVFDLANLLRTLARSSDEVSLAGVLRSPFFNLQDETLFWLVYQSGTLAGAMLEESVPPELESDQAERVNFARQTLARLRAEKDRLPIAELIQHALALTGYDATLVAEFMGERKLANLRKLVDLARSFDSSGIFTLDDYITELSESVAAMPKEAMAATEAEKSDVVRLMTIHQSKGLEFPVVVVPDINRQPRAASEQVAFDPQLGPLVKPADDAQRKGSGPGLELYRLVSGDEETAEQLRLFYVAVTRAADYLVLSAGVPRLGDMANPWTKLLGERFNLTTGETLATELSAVLAPLAAAGEYRPPIIRVTSTEPLVPPAPAKTRRRDLAEVLAGAISEAPIVPKLARPVAADMTGRRVFSVSRLSGSLEAFVSTSDDTEHGFAAGGREGAAAFGTLVHGVLEHFDFGMLAAPSSGGPTAQDEVRRLLDRLAEEASDSGKPTADVADAAKLLERFLASPRALELARSPRVLREVEFLLAWPPDSVHKPDGSGLSLRGYLDCLYQDAQGGWQLIDYKTNLISAAGVPGAALTYEMQMLLYGLVVEQVTGKPAAGIHLCFLRPGVEHSFTWGASARHRAIELIDRALAGVRPASRVELRRMGTRRAQQV